MNLLLPSRPGDLPGLGDPTPHIRRKEENRLLSVSVCSEVQKTQFQALALGGSWNQRQRFPKCIVLCSLLINHVKIGLLSQFSM